MKIKITKENQTSDTVQYSVDVVGFKNLNVWLQTIKKDEDEVKARVVIRYELSRVGKIMGLESEVDPEKIKEMVDDNIDEIVESIKKHLCCAGEED